MSKQEKPKDCTTCAFLSSYVNIPWCTLRKMPILNLDIGCSKQMFTSEFKSGNVYVTGEEVQAAAEAEAMNELIKENKNDT